MDFSIGTLYGSTVDTLVKVCTNIKVPCVCLFHHSGMKFNYIIIPVSDEKVKRINMKNPLNT